MVKINSAYALENPLQGVFPRPIVSQRDPTANDKNYPIGQLWVNKAADSVFGLTSVTGSGASWDAFSAAGTGAVTTLTGDTGGAISPTLGNINILGGSGVSVAGGGDTLTINADDDGIPITQFVVGPIGEAGYQVIQDAIDAAVIAGGGVVYIQPGTYTEDLILASNVHLYGTPATSSLATSSTIIVGTHTPPSSGQIAFNTLYFQSLTSVLFDAGPGSSLISFNNCTSACAAGYLIDLVAWSGGFQVENHLAAPPSPPFPISDGGINNSGSALCAIKNSIFGYGAVASMNLTGDTTLFYSVIGCNITISSMANVESMYVRHLEPILISDPASAYFYGCTFLPSTGAALTQSSTSGIQLSNCTIESDTTPAIAGAGTGDVQLSNVNFTSDKGIANTLTQVYSSTYGGAYNGASFTVGSLAQAVDAGQGIFNADNAIFETFLTTAGGTNGAQYTPFYSNFTSRIGDGTDNNWNMQMDYGAANCNIAAGGAIETTSTQRNGAIIADQLFGIRTNTAVEEADAADQAQDIICGGQHIINFEAGAAIPTATYVSSVLGLVDYSPALDNLGHGYIASRVAGSGASVNPAGAAFKVITTAAFDDWDYGVDLYTGDATNNYAQADIRLANQTTIDGSVASVAGFSAAIDVATTVRGQSLIADGDEGTGVASTVMFTNVVDETLSSGAGAVLMTTANPGNSSGWLKIYNGTAVRYIPYWTDIAP